MIIASSEKQITILLDPDSRKSKQTLAYALCNKIAVREVDINKDPLTGTQLVALAGMMKIPVMKLADIESQLYHEKMKGVKNFSEKDWVKVLAENPCLLRLPIILKGDKAMIVNTPTDILYL